MLNTLRETISKKVAANVLTETVKPISDLLNLAQKKPKLSFCYLQQMSLATEKL